MRSIKKFIISISGICVAGMPLLALATTISINTNLPGTNGVSTGPGGWVANFYQYALLLSGIIAMGAITYGAVKYSLSPGNPSAQSDAKEWIMGAIYGIILLAGAYIILNVVNPSLTTLQLPSLPEVSGNVLSNSSGTTPNSGTSNQTQNQTPSSAPVSTGSGPDGGD